MNEQNFYECPLCGAQGRILSIIPLIDTIRYDVVKCGCGSEWRVYYKFESPKAEITYMPSQEVGPARSTEVVAEENTQGE